MGGTVPYRSRTDDGRVSRRARSLFAAARDENDIVVASLFVNPAQFGPARTSTRYPRDEERDAADSPSRRASTSSSRLLPRRCTPSASKRGSRSRSSGHTLEGEFRPGHFRGVATVCLKLFNIVRPRPRLLRPEGCPAGRGHRSGWLRDLNLDLEIRVVRQCATTTASRSRPATPTSRPRNARRRSRFPARSRPQRSGKRHASSCKRPRGRLRRGRRARRPRVLAAAVRVGEHPTHRQRRSGRRHRMSTPPEGKAAAPRARRDEAARREDRDGHRLRLPGARFAEDAGVDVDPRRRHGRDGRARPRGDDGAR